MDKPSIKKKNWDWIIIGTGTGGATLGYALAKAGKEVLFLEKGRHNNGEVPPPLLGNYAETFFLDPKFNNVPRTEILARAGRYWDRVIDLSGWWQRFFTPHIGMGAGGSSAVYGMVMDRFFPEDFHPQHQFPGSKANIPESWPVTYEELRPYYQAAEALFEVKGEKDPLRSHLDPLPPPPPMSQANAALAKHFEEKGLHPYQMRMACRFEEGCQLCSGYLCPKECKRTALNTCLQPALNFPQVEILDQCSVLSLESDKRRVTGVICRHQGDTFTLHGNTIVLAAGALHTPNILLQSKSVDWPDGLANTSGQVGRNLMRQYLDFYAIKPSDNEQLPPNIKEIAFNDFYVTQGKKLGTVQSFGHLPPPKMLVGHLLQVLEESKYVGARCLFTAIKKPLENLIRWRLSNRLMLTSLVEDLPYPHNQVKSKNPSHVSIHYHITGEEKRRIRLMRQKMRQALRDQSYMRIPQASNNSVLPHICGTCRFGDDPKTSVVNRHNRAHECENLYVVDSSFFPTSSGTDPSLTIAANALRVAQHLIG